MKIVRNSLLIALFTLAIITSFFSCKKNDDDVVLVGNWIEKAEMAGDARYEAVAFSIGEIGFVGTGYNGDIRLNDFWAYDAEKNNWFAIAKDTAMAPRTGAVAFSIGGKGYVGSGRDNQNYLKDFWSYDPAANKWSRVADIPVARYGAVAFSINDIGYVGTGYNGSTLSDFFAYNPGTNTWSPVTNYPSKVREAVAFVIDNKGYVCTGEKNAAYSDDFFRYNPEDNTWDPLRKIDNVSSESYDDAYTIRRQKAVAFTIGNKAYIATGEMQGFKPDTWEYDPATDLWTAKTIFEGQPRINAVAFSTQSGRAFITTGQNGAFAFDDSYEFKPFDDFNDND